MKGRFTWMMHNIMVFPTKIALYKCNEMLSRDLSPIAIQFQLSFESISIMREIIILVLLLSQGFSLDECNQVNVTVENKLENAEADAHIHELERRAISHSKLILLLYYNNSILLSYLKFSTML